MSKKKMTDSKMNQTTAEVQSAIIPEQKSEGGNSESQSDGFCSTLRVGSLLRTWAEVSRINYMSSEPLDVITLGESIRRRSIGLPGKIHSIQCFVPSELRNKSEEDLFAEQFPVNMTPLMNEGQLWGCFYIFPELYADAYSPVVKIRNIEDVPELVGGELTRDMVTACLSYLKRIPILGDFVYIRLDLSSKYLININVLQHYKYIVYLDLSANLLTELTVLSHLPYLQHLLVGFNRLSNVLEYNTPQWFLTEVHYKFNSVKRIRDLSAFWSITILDLSHNNIKCISGLESLRYLRRLDLSFNHIQRLENLNHLRLLWLDVSYNNISCFEFGSKKGLHTLLHLEYLNLNENNLTSLKMFAGCTRLRELHLRNNGLSMLLELAVYMRQMRRLIVIDLRANPICSTPGYKDVVINTFPILLNLDAEQLDPIEQRSSKLDMTPDINMFATRRLLRLLYVEQLSRATISPAVPPADTKEVPVVIIVGYEAVGKGTLARRLAAECKSNIELALQHTTASHHYPGHYKEVSRSKFDDMLLAGELLTYSEIAGESYGLSRDEAIINEGKVKLVTMDLVGALMLKLRGRRPYLILATYMEKMALYRRQQERKKSRNAANQRRLSLETPLERSTLQVLLSGRIIITGILNEILLSLPEEKEKSEFVMESECSLMMDSEARQAVRDYARGVNLLTFLASSTTSLDEARLQRVQDKSSGEQMDPSLYSLYKESQATDEYNSFVNGQNSYQERNHPKKLSEVRPSRTKQDKQSSLTRPKSVDFSRYTSSTWKGLSGQVPGSSKSSKSVTFTSPDNVDMPDQMEMSGMLIERQKSTIDDKSRAVRSISTKAPWQTKAQHSHVGSGTSLEDLDLWLAFLIETGLVQASGSVFQPSDDAVPRHDTRIDDPEAILKELEFYQKVKESWESSSTTIRDEYDTIHRKLPGLFSDTVTMDDPNKAFHKVKGIIQDIMKSQPNLNPMFDVDFANMDHYPTVQKKLANIRNQIAPHRLFY